jgi:hypothetical protein
MHNREKNRRALKEEKWVGRKHWGLFCLVNAKLSVLSSRYTSSVEGRTMREKEVHSPLESAMSSYYYHRAVSTTAVSSSSSSSSASVVVIIIVVVVLLSALAIIAVYVCAFQRSLFFHRRSFSFSSYVYCAYSDF